MKACNHDYVPIHIGTLNIIRLFGIKQYFSYSICKIKTFLVKNFKILNQTLDKSINGMFHNDTMTINNYKYILLISLMLYINEYMQCI